MQNSLESLRGDYDDFLRLEMFGNVEKISTAIDIFSSLARKRSESSGDHVHVGWGCPRVKFNLNDLRSFKPMLEQRFRMDPLRHLRALEAACHNVAIEERPGYDKNNVKIKVAIEGPIGADASSPRNLTASSLRQLVCVEGVATKVSTVKPKVVRSVHFCPMTDKHEDRQYVDATDPQLGLPAVDIYGRELPDRIINITSTVYPVKDKENNPLETEFGLSVYKDYQTVVLQEMPEKAPMGQLPRSVDLVLDDDLVDSIKPGDRVQIVGVFRALATSASGQSTTSGVFKTVILVNSIRILGKDVNPLKFVDTDIREIKSLSKRRDILSILGRSIAPSIHGHAIIKKALALQLLSGCEKNLENGTHLRGDINILMVGDPSTAKSQLLRAAMLIAPLAVSTSGKGSSGVGLTAAVTSDPDTRERRLEAGAMVLADRGIVCIDEFDKMTEADRVSIHEAMEQQTVTITKAGIQASLNARCSVLAAANPVYGQYDRKRRVQENIGLPDSLLSRFDLLFVVLDQLDPESDRRIASHVMKGHRFRETNNIIGQLCEHDDDESDEETSAKTAVWQRSKYSNEERREVLLEDSKDEYDHGSEDFLHHDFLRKYIHYAKSRPIPPKLSEEARDYIASRYAEMRGRQDDRTLPITARSLETIIRLATAHAKARLSPVVESDPDCYAAMDILAYALYHEMIDSSPNDTQRNIRRKVSESQHTDEQYNVNTVETRLWNALLSSKDQGITADALCPDISNRVLINQTLQRWETENRLMISDGMVLLL